MSSTPADTSILNRIGLRLANITVANGYNNEFTPNIDRGRMVPFKGHDLPAINYYHTGVSSVRAKYGVDIKTMFLVVEAHSKTRDDPFVDIADLLAADIVVGLHRSTAKPKVSDLLNMDLSGTVKNFLYLGHDPFIGQGSEPFCGTLVRFEIVYETEIGNMVIYS